MQLLLLESYMSHLELLLQSSTTPYVILFKRLIQRHILWSNYQDLEEAPVRTMAVYYFLESGQISPMSDTLIEGLTTEIANAVAYEGIRISVVSRTKLDRILDELAFQSTDLVDPDAQRSVGKQLGAELIVTGTIGKVEQGTKFNIQLIEVETGVVLGGRIMYLIQ